MHYSMQPGLAVLHYSSLCITPWRFKTSAFVAVAVALLLPRYADLEELRGHPPSTLVRRFKTFEPVALFLPISADSTTSLCVHPFSPPAPRFKTPELVAVAVALFLPISADSTRTSARVAVAVALLLARYADLDKLRVHPFSPPAPRFKSFEPVAVAVALFLPISADSTTRFKTSGRVAVAVAVALLLARYADLDKISAVGNKQVWQDTSQSSSESW
ncbi:hypothetical protein B0H11DRAFT_1924168 [Mycena galericulata]|nr:hypothetical protein B0H11DRAFT_1924168 [Mycena galericulata]